MEEEDPERAARKAARKAERKAEKRAAREAEAAAAAPEADAEDAAPEPAPAQAPAAAAGKKRTREADAPAFAPAPVPPSSSSSAAPAAALLVTVTDPNGKQWAPLPTFAALAAVAPAELSPAWATFKAPTPIQANAWPVLFGGRDLIGIASTGSGKTLAFCLPGFSRILAAARAGGAGAGAGAGPRRVSMLVLSPTRELAMQSAAVADAVGAAARVRSVCVYGGVSKEVQAQALRGANTAQVVVATPGRLLDLVQDKACDLGGVTYLVLDEADRMLDMGFERDIRAIIALLPRAGTRQTAMFSATWPPAIQKIAEEHLHRAVKVVIGSAELSATKTVTQLVDVVEPADKDRTLLRLLSQYHSSRKNRVIVFCLYKKEAARMETFLQQRGWPCCAIHGDMTQDARTRAFNSFRDGQVPLLVATDVAARGLDIPQVEYVINLTFPLTIEDYVHRIGRTGRAGARGISHTLFTSLDKAHAGELVNVLREAGAEVPEALLRFGTHVKKKEHPVYGAHYRAMDGPAKEPTRMTFD
jgi:ATP-dependent RNA helicase DBP3